MVEPLISEVNKTFLQIIGFLFKRILHQDLNNAISLRQIFECPGQIKNHKKKKNEWNLIR